MNPTRTARTRIATTVTCRTLLGFRVIRQDLEAFNANHHVFPTKEGSTCMVLLADSWVPAKGILGPHFAATPAFDNLMTLLAEPNREMRGSMAGLFYALQALAAR